MNIILKHKDFLEGKKTLDVYNINSIGLIKVDTGGRIRSTERCGADHCFKRFSADYI